MELSDGKGLKASIEIPAKVFEPPPVPKSRITLEFCMWLQREFDEILKGEKYEFGGSNCPESKEIILGNSSRRLSE